MKYCKICSRELKEEFEDPLKEVDGKICHRCFLRRAGAKISWDIETPEKKPPTDINELGMMAVFLAFADIELLKEARKKIISDPNPVITQESMNRVIRVIDAALQRDL